MVRDMAKAQTDQTTQTFLEWCKAQHHHHPTPYTPHPSYQPTSRSHHLTLKPKLLTGASFTMLWLAWESHHKLLAYCLARYQELLDSAYQGKAWFSGVQRQLLGCHELPQSLSRRFHASARHAGTKLLSVTLRTRRLGTRSRSCNEACNSAEPQEALPQALPRRVIQLALRQVQAHDEYH